MQLGLEARVDGKPLNAVQKRAHVTIPVMAGADTTGTAMGSTLDYLLTHPSCLHKLRAEIDAADAKGVLSPIQYEETRQYLPHMTAWWTLSQAAVDEFLRPYRWPRSAQIGSTWLPEGTEMMTYACVVQRDPDVFGPDPEVFRPERWLESEERSARMEASLFAFGMGPRVVGKDIAIFEMSKLLPEIIRRFDLDLISEGKYTVVGGVAYNRDSVVKMKARTK
ncbi:hypothetical protein OQA88_13420 [Cercophora sp. LCS_1]